MRFIYFGSVSMLMAATTRWSTSIRNKLAATFPMRMARAGALLHAIPSFDLMWIVKFINLSLTLQLPHRFVALASVRADDLKPKKRLQLVPILWTYQLREGNESENKINRPKANLLVLCRLRTHSRTWNFNIIVWSLCASDRNSEWLLFISVISTAYSLTFIALTSHTTVFLVFLWFDFLARFEFDERKVMVTKLLFARTHTRAHALTKRPALCGIPSHSLMTTMTFITIRISNILWRIVHSKSRIGRPAHKLVSNFIHTHSVKIGVSIWERRMFFLLPSCSNACQFMIFNEFYYYHFDVVLDTIYRLNKTWCCLACAYIKRGIFHTNFV